MAGEDNHFDVLIVGAGISGIAMAAQITMQCPGRRFAVVEQRAQLGGTWDLFRYPGVRSDSDMHSFGFAFAPWDDEQAIAPGEAILAYLGRVVRERGIDRHIRFGTRVISADWRAGEARWHVVLEDTAGRHEATAPRAGGRHHPDRDCHPDAGNRRRHRRS